jgi:hypothetical protein
MKADCTTSLCADSLGRMSYAKSRFLPDDNFDSVLCNEHTFIPGDIDDSASVVIPPTNHILNKAA